MSDMPTRGRMFFSLGVDMATMRLVRAMQAIHLARVEDPDMARGLVDRAKAVRAFVEAAEWPIAAEVLDQMLKVDVSAGASGVIQRRVDAVKVHLAKP